MTRLRFLLALAALGAAALLPAQTVTPLRTSGSRANCINLVFLAEGYTAAEAAKFRADAEARLEVLIGNEAFARFADSINAFAVFVASEESGSDIPSQQITRNTYFNSSFGSNGLDRLLAIPPSTPVVKDAALGTGRVISVLQATVPEYDIPILIVNSTVYGGSGGFPSVVSLNPASDEVLLHELGHSFANLTDEYVDEAAAPFYPPAERINATQKTERNQIPWLDFIRPATPVPTLASDGDPNLVGLFEGSHYRATGFYRPTDNSKMRSIGLPFGPVNLRAFANAVHRLNLNLAASIPIITDQPAPATVTAGHDVTLRVGVTGAGPFTYQWRRDGTYTAASIGPELRLDPARVADTGSYLVEVTNAAGMMASRAVTVTVLPPPDSLSIVTQPAGQSAPVGATAVLAVTVAASPAPTYQWFRNGTAVPGATGASLTIAPVRPADAGVYTVAATNASGTVTSDPALLGVTTTALLAGDAFSDPSWRSIRHPNTRRYSQVLLTGPAATVTADPDHTTRVSFIDLQDDIVQLEFSGAGTMTVTLAEATGPAYPLKYFQAVQYMRGHASVVIQGADATTNFAAFSVGRLTAVNAALFRGDVVYDGHADLARLVIGSPTGRFGGLYLANAAFSDAAGPTGIHAPAVSVAGPVRLHDLRAYDQASPVLLFLATPNADSGLRVTGGDMEQPNGRAIALSGVKQVLMTAGTDSHDRAEPAQPNRGRYESDGNDVTDTVVVPAGKP